MPSPPPAARKRSSSTSAAEPAAPKTATERFRPKTRVRRAARLFIIERFDSMWACLPAALAGDAEDGIHQMRVEAKRLREAMRLFRRAFRSTDYEVLLREVDRLNDHLGLVRDADVLADEIKKLARDQGSAMLDALRDELNRNRQTDQDALITYLRDLTTNGFEQTFRRMVAVGRHPADHATAGQRLGAFAPLEVGRRLSRVLKRLRQVKGEGDVLGLHKARIANKHLRYAMETFAGIYDRRFATALERVVELHKALGDVHDLDVLADRIRAYAERCDGVSEVAAQLQAIAMQRSRLFGRLEACLSASGVKAFGRAVNDTLE